MDTYALDVGYFVTPVVNATVGYYYQNGDLGTADGSGVLGRVAYEMTSGVTAGVNISYDEAFDTRVSADLKVRFGGPSTTAAKKKKWQTPTLNALTASPNNRDVRVHDWLGFKGAGWKCTGTNRTGYHWTYYRPNYDTHAKHCYKTK